MENDARLTCIDDDSSNGISVATDPFRCTMDNDIRAVLDRPNEVSSGTKGVIDKEWDTVIVCDLGEFRNRGDIIFGIAFYEE